MHGRSSTARQTALLAIILLIGIAGLPLPEMSAAQRVEVEVERELASIRTMLDRILDDYREGRMAKATQASRLVYLDHFELIEIPLRVIDPDLTVAMESAFANLRTQIRNRAEASAIDRIVRQLRQDLEEIEVILTGPRDSGSNAGLY